MRAVRIDKAWGRRGAHVHRICRHCGRVLRVGQVALIAEMPNAPITERIFAVHVGCMRTLVETAPDDDDMDAFNALRDKILTSGTAFPD